MNISSTNASLHIQLKPQNFNLAYLALVRFGQTPILNATVKQYDYWKVLCPNSSDIYSVNDTNIGAIDTFYLIFMNMAQVNGFKGLVGYGIRELTSSEQSLYCNISKPAPKNPPLLPSSLNSTHFTSDFSLKSYTSGCYCYNPSNGKWNSYGMEIYPDTSLVMTHCLTNHLTQFAGGLIVVPNQINFEYIIQNASPAKNPTIFAVVVTILCLYILFLAWAYRADKLDERRLGINILEDNLFGDIYSYEVIVFTGNRREAATDSKVSKKLHFILFL